MAAINSTLRLYDKMSPALSAITKAMNSTLSAARSVKGAELGPEFAQAAADVELATRAIDDMNAALQETPTTTQAVGDGYTMMKGLAVSALTAIARYAKNAIGDIMDLTDTLTSSSARLGLIAAAGESVVEIQENIFAAAQRSRGEYLDMVDAVAKLRLQAADAFTSTEEAVHFVELLNKQFTISGTSAAGVESVMYNLTQALSSGVLRGQDLNAVFANTPTIIQAIADYLEVPIGQIRSMAAEGELSANIVKEAMFAAAAETNAKFAELPMTIGQIGTAMKNEMIVSIQPFLQALAKGAQWVYENWNKVGPVFVGVGVAILAAATGLAIYAIATKIATLATTGFITAAMPILGIALAIGLLVGVIYGISAAMDDAEDTTADYEAELNALIAPMTRTTDAASDLSRVYSGLETTEYTNAVMAAQLAKRFGSIIQSGNLTEASMQNLSSTYEYLNELVPNLEKNLIAQDATMKGAISGLQDMSAEASGLYGLERAIYAVTDAYLAFAKAAAYVSAYQGLMTEAATTIIRARIETETLQSEYAAQLERSRMYPGGYAAAASAAPGVQAAIAEQNAAIAAGETLMDKYLGGMLDEMGKMAEFGDMFDNVTVGKAVRTTGDVNLSREAIRLLLDLATRDFSITYQVLEPQLVLNVDTIRETADVDQIINIIAEEVQEMADASLYA